MIYNNIMIFKKTWNFVTNVFITKAIFIIEKVALYITEAEVIDLVQHDSMNDILLDPLI